PSQMDRARFAQVFSPLLPEAWIADRAWQMELGPAHDSAVGLLSVFVRVLRQATPAERGNLTSAAFEADILPRLQALLP
ncbi:MAG: polysaccharide deacetylase, partial [Roseovarius sp.]